MEAQPKSSDSLGRSPVLNHPCRPRPAATGGTPFPRREVIRCRQCLLVQLRTLSNFCRRCAQPLPPPVVRCEPCDPARESLPNASVPAPAGVPAPIPDHGFRAGKLAVGHVVRRMRKQRLLTQEQMAARLGIPRSYISRIENRRVLPGPPLLSRIAAALAVETSDLLRHDAARGFDPPLAADPTARAVLYYFSQLAPRERNEVLSAARRMVSRNEVPLPQANSQPRL